MAEQISIYQTQAINFTDTSSGGLAPLSRLWAFPGGSITSATGATATVFYNTTGNFTVSLTITDGAGTVKTELKTNLVKVDPAFISANFTGTPTSTLLMSTPINFVDTTTGQPSGPNTWSWDIQGYSYSTQNVSFPGFDDWFAIGGMPGDSPGHIIPANVSLTASNGALVDTESKGFSVAKIGPLETNWINSRGITGPWATDSLFSVEMNGAVPLVTSDIGYPGSEIIYSINLNSPPFTQNINSFHTTTENSTFYLTGMPNPEAIGLNQTSGYIIIDDLLYLSGQTQIMDGQYITPGLVDKIYFTAPLIDSAYNGSYNGNGFAYSLALVESVCNSLYPQTNSGQAPSFNCVFPTNSAFGSQDSPIVPSFQQLTNLGVPIPYQVGLQVRFFGGALSTTLVSMTDNGGVGNEISGPGDWYVMQDTIGGTGVASMLNSGIASSIPGGTGSLEFYTSPIYNTNVGGPGPTGDYHGLSLQIKNRNISSVNIIDNSFQIFILYSVNFPPFAYSFSSPTPSTCSGLMKNIELASYTPEFGTRIEYGASIY